jgi:hypothetical protein
MNLFYEHHKDRILLNGLIQPFQQPERVVGFFNTYRKLYPVTRQTLRGADQFQWWVRERAAKRNIPIVEAPKRSSRRIYWRSSKHVIRRAS